jgi:membrane fusion protein
MADLSTLFRPEALRARADGALGPIALVLPPRSLRVTALAAGSGFALLAALVAGHLPSTATLDGHVVAGADAPAVQARSAGVLTGLTVRNGQSVRRGQRLAIVGSDTVSAQGGTQARVLSSLDTQRTALQSSVSELQDQLARQRARAQDHRRLVDVAQGQLAGEADLQRQQVRLLEAQLVRLQPAIAQHLVAGSTVDDLRARVLDAQTRLADLERQRATGAADQSSAEATGETTLHQLQLQIDQAHQQLSELDARRSAALASIATELRAPVDGVVANLTLQEGAAVQAGQTVLSVLPAHTTLQAEVLAPADIAAHLQVGQGVRIAFAGETSAAPEPVAGQVSAVDAAAGTGAQQGLFRVWVALPQASSAWRPGTPVRTVVALPSRALGSVLLGGR